MPNKQHYLKEELDQLVRSDGSIFSFLEDSAFDGIWYWDLQHPEIEWMDETFWRLFGYNPADKQHLASEWQDMIFAEDLQTALENFDRHLANPDHPYDQVVRYRHKDGSTVWVRCRGMAIRDSQGNPVRMLGAHNDITTVMKAQLDLQQAIAEIQQKNQETSNALKKYRQLYDNMKDGFVVAHMDGKLVEVNHVVETMVGYRRDELLNMTHMDLTVRKPDYVRQNEDNQNLIESKGYTDWFRTEYRHKDGHAVPVEVRVYKVENYFENGKPGIWAIIVDLSKQLAREVEMKAQEQLLIENAKLASMGEMVNAIAHQWRQPLNILSGVIMNLVDANRYGELDDYYLYKQARIAEQNIRYMSQTIDDFKEFIHPAQPSTAFCLVEAIEAALSIVAVQLKSQRIDLQTNYPVAHPPIIIRGKSNEFGQAIINLINNAKDAINQRIGGAALNGEIRLQVGLENDDATVRIIDNGTGIEETIFDRIFEPYFTTKGDTIGYGIGLYISKMLIEKKLSGSLTLESSVEGNTVFKLSLPVVNDSEAKKLCQKCGKHNADAKSCNLIQSVRI